MQAHRPALISPMMMLVDAANAERLHRSWIVVIAEIRGLLGMR